MLFYPSTLLLLSTNIALFNSITPCICTCSWKLYIVLVYCIFYLILSQLHKITLIPIRKILNIRSDWTSLQYTHRSTTTLKPLTRSEEQWSSCNNLVFCWQTGSWHSCGCYFDMSHPPKHYYRLSNSPQGPTRPQTPFTNVWRKITKFRRDWPWL